MLLNVAEEWSITVLVEQVEDFFFSQDLADRLEAVQVVRIQESVDFLHLKHI